MDQKAAIFLLFLAIVITGSTLPMLTQTARQEQHNFEWKPLQDDQIMKGRHFSLIRKTAYLDFIQSDFEGNNVRFKTEESDDSFAILATTLSGYNKGQFNAFFYNQKTAAKLDTLKDLPANIIDTEKQYGFRVYQLKKDSITYLQLPYDMVMGPLQMKNETQYEKKALVQKTK